MNVTVSLNGQYIKLKFRHCGHLYQFSPIKGGRSDNPSHRAEAERIARWIQSDIEFGQFDPTLEKYKPQRFQPSQQRKETLTDIWEAYLSYKQKGWRPSTVYYMGELFKLIKRCPYQTIDALKIREWLLANSTESMTKRCLVHTHAAVKFAIKHGLVRLAASPFEGLASDLKHQYEIESIPMVLSVEEKERLLNAFRTHKGNWNGRGYSGYKFSFYYPYVATLFLTGRRPEEVLQWEWSMVKESHIAIPGRITKTARDGKFPLYPELVEVLDSLPKTESLVFRSVKGLRLEYDRFSQRVWGKVVDPLFPDKRLTPRCGRDTFITEQILLHGRSESVVAQWCDTSPSEIRKRYLGDSVIYNLKPGS